MSPIMVPLDGSAIAERALPFAQALAHTAGQPLFLVRIVPLELSTDHPDPSHEAASYLNDVAARLAGGSPVRTLVLTGSPADRLVATIEAEGVATVVLTTHGRSAFGRLLYGSVARSILLRCPVPLLMVRAWTTPSPPFVGPPSRVLVPLDGSPLAEAVLPAASTFAQQLGAELLVLRVVTPPERIASGTLGLLLAAAEPGLDRSVAEADRYLLAVRDAVHGSAPSVPVRTAVRIGQPSAEIRALSAEEGVALVAMATHGYSGLAWLALGSVAEDVLRHGTRPLLLVRPPHLGHGQDTVTATVASTKSDARAE